MISSKCVILHKKIVRIQQNGDFCDEVDVVNLITELLETDDHTRIEVAIKYEDNRRRIIIEIAMDWDEQFVR